MVPERRYLGSDVVPYSEVGRRGRRRDTPTLSALDDHGSAIGRLRAWLSVTRAIGLVLAVIGPGAVIATVVRAVVDRNVAQDIVQNAVQNGVRSEVSARTAATRARGREVVDGWNLCPDCALGNRVRDAWDGLFPNRGTP